jgi:hypothetical protein
MIRSTGRWVSIIADRATLVLFLFGESRSDDRSGARIDLAGIAGNVTDRCVSALWSIYRCSSSGRGTIRLSTLRIWFAGGLLIVICFVEKAAGGNTTGRVCLTKCTPNYSISVFPFQPRPGSRPGCCFPVVASRLALHGLRADLRSGPFRPSGGLLDQSSDGFPRSERRVFSLNFLFQAGFIMADHRRTIPSRS